MLIDDIKNRKVLSVWDAFGCGYAMFKQNITPALFILLIIYFPISLLSGYITIAVSNLAASVDIDAIMSNQEMLMNFVNSSEYVKLAMYNLGSSLIDFILSLIALIVLSPILLIVALLVRTKLGSPVIFKQERPGLNEKIFTLYKFRTMTDAKDEQGNLLPDEIRLTKFGKLLRSTSLDELPELFNILKGDMAIVGPRPLLVRYLQLYNEHQKHRHDVRPGFTGWAQCNGRNAISWEEKFDLDVYYTKHVSLLLDIKIILKTVKVVLFREGISSETSVTMEEFRGSNNEG